MLTLLGALIVCAMVAAPALAGLVPWRPDVRGGGRTVGADGAAARVNPWPAAPAVAAGPRLYDRERVTAC